MKFRGSKPLWLVLVAGLAVIAAATALLWPSSRQGLVLYSAVDYGVPVAEAFTRETGIPVTVISLSTGSLLAKISAEGGRPGWSMAWFDGDEAMAALDRAGLTAKRTVPDLPWTPMGRSLVPADGAWTPTGISLAGVFSYRAGLAEPPAAWNDLLKPAVFIDSQVDQATGQFRLKAVFPNDDGALWPGEFVTARLELRVDRNAVTVPSQAVLHGQDGDYVYAVAADETVSARTVGPGPAHGGYTEILSGLKSGERIVLDGQSRVAPGVRVQSSNAAEAADATGSAP